jgi:superfamily II RNA helicase
VIPAAVRGRARKELARGRSYALDPFQEKALEILDDGRSVLVAAPTGSGKTVVAEYAVFLALAEQRRVFYTTPLKALSNQKFGDFCRRLGREQVGLLTGDNSINPDAPVVVMTTEVLRNMIYADPKRLSGLAFVVLDEVHYLEDRYRGAVWEEVILNAPAHVVLVCLSATVSNAEQLRDWIASVRGSAGSVIEEKRPIELRHLFAIGDRSAERILLLPTFVDGRPNPAAISLDERASLIKTNRRGPRRTHPTRLYRPRRIEMVERLAEESLLPAIFFVFSRAGCDDAVRHCLEGGIRLTTPEERRRAREIAEDHVEALSDDDLSVLGYGRFIAGLEAGVAAHHAGMVPPFKEAVEACFAEAIVKVVFATETLALGINMPARSVVVEQLSKFNGDTHEDLTPGEYTQLTGRAGRRGIDDVGDAVALWSPYHSFAEVASLASSRSRALRSSFRPTYNMAVNLVRRYGRREAYALVDKSFAQWLSTESLARQLDAVVKLLDERGYLAGWALTPAGGLLAGIYHDADLLVAEAAGQGLFDGLDPAGLAALVSTFTYETRRGEPLAAGFPSSRVARRYDALSDLAAGLRADERRLRLPVTRELDTGFTGLASAWARGEDLRLVLTPAAAGRGRNAPPVMTGGDFVRSTKQLIDLLRQLGLALSGSRTGSAANAAAEMLLRDVVAAASAVYGGDDEPVDGHEPLPVPAGDLDDWDDLEGTVGPLEGVHREGADPQAQGGAAPAGGSASPPGAIRVGTPPNP